MRQCLQAGFALLGKLNFRLFCSPEAQLSRLCSAGSALPRDSCDLPEPWAWTGLTGEPEITRAKAPWPHSRICTLKSHLPGNIPTQGIPHRLQPPGCLWMFLLWKDCYSILTSNDCTFIFHFTDWVCFSNSSLAIFAIVVVYAVFLGKL